MNGGIVYCVTMVLRSDIKPIGYQLLKPVDCDFDVHIQLVGLCCLYKAHGLMSQANSKNGLPILKELSQMLDGRNALLGAGPLEINRPSYVSWE